MKKKDLQKKLAKLTGEKVDNSLTVAELKEAISQHQEDSGDNDEKNKGGRPRKPKYRALSTLSLEGKNYNPGDELPLDIVSELSNLKALLRKRLIEVS